MKACTPAAGTLLATVHGPPQRHEGMHAMRGARGEHLRSRPPAVACGYSPLGASAPSASTASMHAQPRGEPFSGAQLVLCVAGNRP